MSPAKLPAQAANVLRAIGGTATCTPTQVESLKLLLLPATPTTIAKPIEKNTARQKSKKPVNAQLKTAGSRAKKLPAVTIHECEEEGNHDTLGTRGRIVLATEIINLALKSLTLAIKTSRTPQTPRLKRRSLVRSSSSTSFSGTATPIRSPPPLQPISVNRILQSPAKPKQLRRSSSGPFHGSNNIRSQAECARIGLACLRHLQSVGSSKVGNDPLQLETAMSALISRFLALGYDDLASKELRILKRRIETFASGQSGATRHGTVHTEKVLKEEDARVQDGLLSNLLKYTTKNLSGPLLALVVTSQTQALKILALGLHVPSIEAALEHLRMEVEHAPANLIERQIDQNDPKSQTNAVHQLETLAQTLMRLCPDTSTAADKSAMAGSSVSAQAAFELQALAFRIRLRCWRLSSHQRSLETEMIRPFARCLGAFQRRCKSESGAKYSIASDSCKIIMAELNKSDEKKMHNMIAMFNVLTIMAIECHQHKEAMEWIKLGLEITETIGGSPSRRCAFLCQLATSLLRERPMSLDDEAVARSLLDATTSLEGDLRGESVELDELLVAVVNLRKSAFLLVQNNPSIFNPSQTFSDASVLGQCTKFLLVSIRFIVRYVGSEPSQGTSDSKLLRYNERKALATQVLPSIVESIVTIAKLSTKSDTAVWLIFDAGLRDCLELAKNLHTDSQEYPNNSGHCSLPYVSLSQAYWFRFLALKSMGAEPNLLARPLQTSINILKNRSSQEKIAGCLLTKLERYAALCESLQDYGRAREYYEDAVTLSIDAGIVHKLADAAKLTPWSSALTKDRDFEQLGRCLHALPKAAARIKGITLCTKTFFDPDWLPLDQRGLVLEQQLFSVTALLLGQSHTSTKSDHLNSLVRTLLSLYDKELFPIRRLRICVRLLHLLTVHPDSLESSLVSAVLVESDKQSSEVAGSLDDGLRRYTTHLRSCVNAFLDLRGRKSNFPYLETILPEWCRLLQQCPIQQSLAEHVYDIPAWLQQLELICCYLKIQGNETLQTAVLHLIVAVREGACSTQCLDLVSGLIDLGIHYTKLGFSGPGGVALHNAQRFLDVSDVPTQLMLKWFLRKAEYDLLKGNVDKCREYLEDAKEAFRSATQSPSRSVKGRAAFAQTAASLMLIESKVFAEEGYQAESLFFARASVQEYQRIWGSIERHNGDKAANSAAEEVNKSLAKSVTELSISNSRADATSRSKYATLGCSAYWDIAPHLFESFLHLSQCFAHNGLLLEAQYYFAQCQKIADAVHSPYMTHACLMLQVQYAIGRGSAEEGLAILQKVEHNVSDLPQHHSDIKTRTFVALNYIRTGQIEAGSVVCSETLDGLRGLASKSALDRLIHKPEAESLALQMSGMKLVQGNQVPTRKSTIAQRKAPKKSRVQPSPTTVLPGEEFLASAVVPLNVLEGELLSISALVKLRQGALDAATSQLDDANALPQRQQDMIMHGLLRAEINLRRCLQNLVGDPVFSILPESSICCPATIVHNDPKVVPKSPPKGTKSAKAVPSRALCRNAMPKNTGTIEGYAQSLFLGRRCLSEILSKAVTSPSTSNVHAISETLGKISTFLSALPGTHTKDSRSSQLLAYILELGRQVAVNRELLSISVERQLSQRRDPENLPSYKALEDGTEWQQDLSFNISGFQEDYINIIPKSWQVVSMTLSRSQEEIWVSKIRPGQSPFILRLPFNRENIPDGDAEVFSFGEGKSEMLEIARMANTSAHNGRDMSGKGAKTEWWDNRAGLDARLKDLLTNIESIWFGGFRGIFSPSVPDPHLLARFQQSLQSILDKHLPSRQTPRKHKQASQVVLDPRVLGLFVGLGQPSEENDIDEHLMDLLYFVVDILQFNKERNAYDEIDFDAIVIETVDALRQYHQAVGTTELNTNTKHTILILDKHLHGFPWESLPCLTGQPISRLPSIGCLRRRILQMRKEQAEKTLSEGPDGVQINPGHGAYVLNPGGDLVNTQAVFEESLESLTNWESFVEREPSEADMKNCLEHNKLFLYFGHGSGRQYMRPRTIKKLEQCAVALLMGCSSGALTEAGEYEAHGTPIDYMHAGCPALLATLWDVTDKDIDRFSKEVLEKWGLFRKRVPPSRSSPVKRSRGQKGKMKAEAKELSAENRDAMASLDEAVAMSRDSCFLRYLNGAAPVVYGVPVYLS